MSSVDPYIVELAYEGVPIGAIARSLRVPSDEVRTVLQGAVASGRITEMPRSDWPPNAPRANRVPGLPAANVTDDTVLLNLGRLFKVTPQQARLFLALLKRREVVRAQLHEASKSRAFGPDEEDTDKKIVDVVICKLRKKLKVFGIEIETMWAWGYGLNPEHRQRAIQLLNEFMGVPVDAIK